MSNLLYDHTTGKPTGDQSSSEDGGSDSDNDDSKNNLNKETDFIPTHFNHDNLLPKPPTQPQPTQKWVKTYCEGRIEAVLERSGSAKARANTDNMSDIFKEAMEEVAAEARNEEQQQTVSFIHAPEILGHHLHVSTGNSSHDKSLFDSSEASELWAEPAIPPSHLEDESNGGHTADESESGCTVAEEINNSVQMKWAEAAIHPVLLGTRK